MRRRFMILSGLVALLTVWGAGAASAATPWAIQATPNPAGATSVSLNGVSCVSATNCTAVGGYITAAGNGQALAEHWNGSKWVLEKAIPDPPGAEGSGLDHVSCSSAASCTAVGSYSISTDSDVPLVEHWNGSKWAVQNLEPGVSDVELAGISCTSATSCTAVGDYYDSPTNQGLLAEHWNGSTWLIQATPNPTGTGVENYGLSGVSCTSAKNCTAVGTYFDSVSSQVLSLVEHWNGSTWSMQAIPLPSGEVGLTLMGVSCNSASSCTATGYSTTPNSPITGGSDSPTVAEHWNGSTWSVQATPNPSGSPDAQLAAVSCTSAKSCTAAGWYTISELNQNVLTLVEHWNGSTWAIQTTPNPAGATSVVLDTISCTSSTSCTAAGSYNNGSPPGPPTFQLAERS